MHVNRLALKEKGRSPDESAMRIVLEWLGLLGPDLTRREPVAVPSWAPYVTAGIMTVATATLAALVSSLLRVLAR